MTAFPGTEAGIKPWEACDSATQALLPSKPGTTVINLALSTAGDWRTAACLFWGRTGEVEQV